MLRICKRMIYLFAAILKFRLEAEYRIKDDFLNKKLKYIEELESIIETQKSINEAYKKSMKELEYCYGKARRYIYDFEHESEMFDATKKALESV